QARHAQFATDQSVHLFHLDLDVHPGRQIELGERIDRLRSRVQDVDQPLVGLQLELLAALLVDVRAPEHRPQLPLGGQRNGPRDLRAGLLGRAHDVGGGLIDQGVVERFETDPDLSRHTLLDYFKIFVTTPPHHHPHVVPRLPLVLQLATHLPPRRHRPLVRPKPHHLHLIPHLHLAPLDPPRRHRPPPRDRKHILHRHQKRLVHLALRNRHVPVQRLQQLPNLPHPPRPPPQPPPPPPPPPPPTTPPLPGPRQ